MHRWNDEDGYVVLDEVMSLHDVSSLQQEAARLFELEGVRPAGIRRILGRSSVFSEFSRSALTRSLVEPALGAGARVVRSLLFDKSPDANWDVPWHQDTTIAVVSKEDVAGYGPWSVKSGVPHVRPPAEVLANMVTVRFSLDVCGEDNGPLLVAPGTHRAGIVGDHADAAVFEASKVACTTKAGGVVMMRPLLFHASRKAATPRHRRVLHLEFAACDLPAPLRWDSE
jgi:hypothetical protein